MPVVDFGMVSLGYSLGEPRDVAANASRYGVQLDFLQQLGFHTYHEVANGETTAVLGAQAGRSALRKGGVDPAEVDLLVVASTTIPEYLNWDLSAGVARELGLRGTPTLLFTQGCAATVLGFAQIAGVFATREDIQTILYVAAERVNPTHTKRLGGSTADSDGAVAAVLQRGHSSLRWLATQEVRDSEYADFFRLEYGGSAVPVPPAGKSNLTTHPVYQVYHYFRNDQEGFHEFGRMCDRRLVEAIDGACAQAGVDRADLSRVILLHDNQPSMKKAAEDLGIPLDRTNAGLAAGLGHFGSLDPLMSLCIYQEQGDLRTGEMVALAGMSSGMCWFCTLVEV
ncbi:MAG TPA: 3-oxoacyl-[acyl-carrier-protein] synthase III C-terminal domain-containing protein [Actinomycetales bacterium]|nr:3-oxoacyl-[acyl-carrier-protein] synthase III C-terminal domain-containing protein [Actinomycetales bacterium]